MSAVKIVLPPRIIPKRPLPGSAIAPSGAIAFSGDLAERFWEALTPEIAATWADRLGVSAAALDAIDCGAYGDCLATPERDASGQIIGWQFRKSDGSKYQATGGKRGLVYPINPNYAGPREPWVDTQRHGVLCPKCGDFKRCSLAGSPSNPQALLCYKVSTGARSQSKDGGYVHVLQERPPLLPATDKPILIVEGATDVMAAFDLGFVAIGQPCASGGVELLKELVRSSHA
jgi:hypothetical protein